MWGLLWRCVRCEGEQRGLLARRAGDDRRALTLTAARIMPVHVAGGVDRGGYWWERWVAVWQKLAAG